jgi:hypothetical protein
MMHDTNPKSMLSGQNRIRSNRPRYATVAKTDVFFSLHIPERPKMSKYC